MNTIRYVADCAAADLSMRVGDDLVSGMSNTTSAEFTIATPGEYGVNIFHVNALGMFYQQNATIVTAGPPLGNMTISAAFNATNRTEGVLDSSCGMIVGANRMIDISVSISEGYLLRYEVYIKYNWTDTNETRIINVTTGDISTYTQTFQVKKYMPLKTFSVVS